MSSLKEMTLGKILNDNKVRYLPKSEKNTINNNSPRRNQKRNISQNNKKFLANVTAQEFVFLKWIKNCYF